MGVAFNFAYDVAHRRFELSVSERRHDRVRVRPALAALAHPAQEGLHGAERNHVRVERPRQPHRAHRGRHTLAVRLRRPLAPDQRGPHAARAHDAPGAVHIRRGRQPPHGPGRPREMELQRPQRAAELQRHHLRVRPERQPDLTKRQPRPDLRMGRGEPAHVRCSTTRRASRRSSTTPWAGGWPRRPARASRASPTTARTSWWRQGPSEPSPTCTAPASTSRWPAESSAGLIRFYHLDGLGSLVKTTDASGNVEGSRSYDSFGQPPISPFNGYAFTSRESDSESGLYYYRGRYYLPELARFLSPDPMPIWARTHRELNAYPYVANSPVTFTDPFGLNIHGNFCGPGSAGIAIDPTDTCCQQHDACYGEDAVSWKNAVFGTGGHRKQSCIRDCDKGLCKCLEDLSEPTTNEERIGRHRVKWWFGCAMFTCPAGSRYVKGNCFTY